MSREHLETGMKRNKIIITHVKMRHKLPNNVSSPYFNEESSDERLLEEVAASQFAIAQYILSNPDTAFAQEGIVEVLTYKKLSENDSELMMHIQKVFNHNDFKKEFSQLTPEQKQLLHENDGAIILLSLKLMDALYPAGSLEMAYALRDGMKDKNQSELEAVERSSRLGREKEGIVFSLKASEESGKNRVGLIFGGTHDFDLAGKIMQNGRFELGETVECRVTIPEVRKQKIELYSDPTLNHPFWTKTELNKNKLIINKEDNDLSDINPAGPLKDLK